MLQRSQQHRSCCNHSVSTALGLSRLAGYLWLFVQWKTSGKGRQGRGERPPSERFVFFTSGSGTTGELFCNQRQNHTPWHLQSPFNRFISCRDTFTMESCFVSEIDQFKEGTGGNALHQDPASHVPCSLQSDAGHLAASACFARGPTCYS